MRVAKYYGYLFGCPIHILNFNPHDFAHVVIFDFAHVVIFDAVNVVIFDAVNAQLTVGIVALRVLMPSMIAGENGIATLGKVTTQEIPGYDYDIKAWCEARANVSWIGIAVSGYNGLRTFTRHIKL